MRLLALSATAAEARVAAAGAGAGAGALRPLLTEDAHALVRGMLALADHASPSTPEGWAAVFDRAAALSPEGSVALYALGDAGRLAAATAEVVDWLRAEALVGPGRRVLEIGCGIGRFVEALRAETALTLGLDVSQAQLSEAARRTPGALLVRSSGRDLAPLPDGAFDLVLAIDSWPYLVNAGVSDAMAAEVARVLAPGGDWVVLNWSYRGEPAADHADAAAAARRLRLVLVDRPAPTLRHWNGALYRFARA